MSSLSGASRAYKNALRKHTKLTRNFLRLSLNFIKLTEKANYFPAKESEEYEKKAKILQEEISKSFDRIIQIIDSIPQDKGREKYRNTLFYGLLCHKRLEKRLNIKELE